MLTKFNLSVLLFILPLFTLSQTCIIAIRTANEIYVAADIRGTLIIDTFDAHKIRHRFTRPSSVCKISRFGENIIFLSAGFSLREIDKMAEQCATYSQTIPYLIRDFTERAKGILIRYYATVGSANKEKVCAQLDTGMEFMFCGFENGVPKISYANLWAINKITEPLRFAEPKYSDAGDPLPNDQTFQLLAIGERDAVESNSKQSDTKDVKGKYVPFLNKLIKLQHNSSPKTVSDSCDIIRQTAHGIDWLQSTGHCQ